MGASTGNSPGVVSSVKLPRVKKFPLAPLVELRAQAVDASRDSLQEAESQLQAARQALAQAEQLERAHDAARHRVEEQEAQLIADGELHARDLALLADYEVEARAQATRLREQNRLQRQKLQRASQAHTEALEALARARAEARLVEDRRERFLCDERSEIEAKGEEEALEIWHVRKVQC